MRTVFLDTVGLVALWDEDDQWHQDAEKAMEEIRKSNCRLVTTPYVLLECGNTAARTSYRKDVHELKKELETHGNLLHPDNKDEEKAWESYLRGEAGNAGIVDHASFVLMRKHQVKQAFTNDRHFRAAGFETLF